MRSNIDIHWVSVTGIEEGKACQATKQPQKPPRKLKWSPACEIRRPQSMFIRNRRGYQKSRVPERLVNAEEKKTLPLHATLLKHNLLIRRCALCPRRQPAQLDDRRVWNRLVDKHRCDKSQGSLMW